MAGCVDSVQPPSMDVHEARFLHRLNDHSWEKITVKWHWCVFTTTCSWADRVVGWRHGGLRFSWQEFFQFTCSFNVDYKWLPWTRSAVWMEYIYRTCLPCVQLWHWFGPPQAQQEVVFYGSPTLFGRRHKFRRQRKRFNGQPEKRAAPIRLSGDEIINQLSDVEFQFDVWQLLG